MGKGEKTEGRVGEAWDLPTGRTMATFPHLLLLRKGENMWEMLPRGMRAEKHNRMLFSENAGVGIHHH